ncbi:alkaline phosphatase D family protein [Raineyella sp. LH-20]|uniref:alkaline phosphatase D family protein n=1 Tax=Raineyella sp. LH-20 TaxID=3081204 RepID=UPI0029536187|nr:alkaline phosphatase D family protein [Raineyella sp. LH-20]WOP18105.1 alkaline phosphatase D family protein [Raineyella sp. LH-20]
MSLSLSRRSLLIAGAAAGAMTMAPPLVASADPRVGSDPFACGVASGDPWPTSVVLWTRLAPEPTALDGFGGLRDPLQEIPVSWEISTDEAFSSHGVVRRGVELATPRWGHSVHAEVDGLEPGREYWYRFRVGNEVSMVGRTKTAPAPDADIASFTSVLATCQNLPAGYFTAFRHIADEQVDLVLHVGDYIYEGGAAGTIGRPHAPLKEIWDLADYRVRFGQYNADPDLILARRSAPFMCVFDDHEVENNWAADRSEIDKEADQDREVWLARRARALQAWYENLPVRKAQRPVGPDVQAYRHLRFGRLADVHMVDTRQYRSFQNDPKTNVTDRWLPGRTMLGAAQEKWLLNGLADRSARWRVMADPVQMAQQDAAAGDAVNVPNDPWDGYAWYRTHLLSQVHDLGVTNFVHMAGNGHWNMASDLLVNFDEADSPVVGADFMATSITSGGDGSEQDATARNRMAASPWLKLANTRRGYQKTVYTKAELRQEIKVLPYVTKPDAPVYTRATAVVRDGVPGISDMIRGTIV